MGSASKAEAAVGEVAGKEGSCANTPGTELVGYLLDDLDQSLQDLPGACGRPCW